MIQKSHSWAYIWTQGKLKKLHIPLGFYHTIHNSQDKETTQMSIYKRMDKEDVAHIYKGILLSHKKEK